MNQHTEVVVGLEAFCRCGSNTYFCQPISLIEDYAAKDIIGAVGRVIIGFVVAVKPINRVAYIGDIGTVFTNRDEYLTCEKLTLYDRGRVSVDFA